MMTTVDDSIQTMKSVGKNWAQHPLRSRFLKPDLKMIVVHKKHLVHLVNMFI